MKFSALPRLAAFALATFGGSAAFAQSSFTAPPQSGSDPKESVVLSPFVVTSESDRGYAATETLAGTRMRTNLKDIGASLTVLTPEFLQDLGVNSFHEALLYTPSVDNVEGDNSDGNRSAGGTLRFGTGQAFSIRGFVTNSGEQSISHDFFTALDTSDNYNLKRITLALGPNALLIGVGNAQGVAVTTTKRAQFNRRKTSVQLQADRHGSNRVALDHNQPLVAGKLALRVNLLHDQKREFRTYEGHDQARGTIGLSAKPFPNTTITVSHENYTVNTNTSSLLWGFDAAMLRWAQAGRPTVDFVSNGQAWTVANRAFVDASGNRIRVATGAVDANGDGFVNSQGEFDPKTGLQQSLGQTQTYVVGLNGVANPLVNFRYEGTLRAATFGAAGGAAYQSGPDPWALLGLDKSYNLNGGTWDDAGIQNHGRWSQIMVEQKLAPDLYLELGANLADDRRDLDPNTYTTVSVDVNRYLPDRTLNPGYLAPYVDNAGMQWRRAHATSAEYRATLSYQFDLTGKSRWLGSHSLAGLYQRSERDSDQDVMRVFNTSTVGRTGWNADAINGVNYIRSRAYLIAGQLPVLPDVNQLINNFSQINGTTLLGATATEQAPVILTLQSFIAAQKSRFTTEVNAVELLTTHGRVALRATHLNQFDLAVEVPSTAPNSIDAVVLVTCASEPETDSVRLLQPAFPSNILRAFDGAIGGGVRFGPGKKTDDYVLNWSDLEGSVSWEVRANEAASYEVSLNYDAPPGTGGNRFAVAVAGQTLEGEVKEGNRQVNSLGRVTMPAGRNTIKVLARDIKGGELFRLRHLELKTITSQ